MNQLPWNNKPSPVCPMFGEHCIYCSEEKATRPYTRIEQNKTTGLYEPKSQGNNIVTLGLYCNNLGQWVRDLHYCPARWALHRGVVKPKEKKNYAKTITKVQDRKGNAPVPQKGRKSKRKPRGKVEGKKRRRPTKNTRTRTHRPAKTIKGIKTKSRSKRSLPRKTSAVKSRGGRKLGASPIPLIQKQKGTRKGS